MDHSSLAKLLTDLQHSDRGTRFRAIEALGNRKDVIAVPALTEILESRDGFSEDRMWWRAAQALGEIGDPAAIPALAKALQSASVNVGMSAAQALGKIGRSEAIPALLEALKHPNQRVGHQAAIALGAIHDLSCVPLMIEMLQCSERQNYARSGIIRALGKLGDASATPALREAVKDAEGREEALHALGEIGDASAVPDLAEALQDREQAIRLEAARALAKIGDDTAIPELAKALQDESHEVRRQAVTALEKIGAPAVSVLVVASRREEQINDYMASATYALRTIGAPAVSALIVELRDENEEFRRSAARVLGMIRDTSATAALMEAAQDSSHAVRANAFRALGTLGAVAAIPIIKEALRREGDTGSAADALRWIGVPAIPTLIEALQEEEATVRQEAAAALKEMGNSHVLPKAILMESKLSIQERIDLLERLRRLQYRDQNTVLQYRFPDTVSLCRAMLKQKDIPGRRREDARKLRAEAQKLLDHLLLLRASQSGRGRDAEELVRGAQGSGSDSNPETLLRPTEEATPARETYRLASTFWQRFRRYWKRAAS